MSGRLEIGDKHMRGQVTLDSQFSIVCGECGFKAGSWEEYGAHVDALLSLPPETGKEAVMNVLSDHLGDLEGWLDDGFEPAVDQYGFIHCGCGWTGDKPVDNDEFRAHLAEAILKELARVH